MSTIGTSISSVKGGEQLDLKKAKERLRQIEQMKLFKENMQFLDRLRNSKGTLKMSKFAEFEKQQNVYKKNIAEATNLITNLSGSAGGTSSF